MIETKVLKTEAIPEYEIGNSNIRISAKVLKELGEFLSSRLRKLKSFRDSTTWNDDKVYGFNAYNMVEKKRPLPFPGASNMSSPLSRIGVDAYHSNVMASLYPNGTNLIVKPVVTNKAFSNTAKKAAAYMTYCMNQEAKSYTVTDDVDKKSNIYGSGYMEPCYVKEEAWETEEIEELITIPELDQLTGEVNIREENKKSIRKRKVVKFDGIKLYSIPVENIYKSPFFGSIQEAVKEDAVFKTFTISLYKLKEGSRKEQDRENFYLKNQVDLLKHAAMNKVFSGLNQLEQARAANDGAYMDLLSRDAILEMAEGHCWYDVDGDGIKEEINATFDEGTGTVVRVTLSKCRIVEFVPRPVDGRGEGEGIPKICRILDMEWENFHNTRANAGQWENTTFGFYRAGGRLNPNAITVQPGKFYAVDDPREVQFANVPRTGQSFFQEEGLVLNYFERIFALDENIQGISSKGTQTATETLRVSNKASVRFANPFNRIVSAFNELLDHVWELNQECAPDGKEFFVTGEDGSPMFDKMTKRDFTSNLKFTLEISSIFDQQLVRDTMLLAYRLFIVNPAMAQHPEMLWELSQQTLDTLGVDIKIPKPDQAKTLSPFEEHEMFKQGETPEPQIGEDYEHHLKVHELILKSPEIKEWPADAVAKLIMHRDQTLILKRTLESANLNKSGIPNFMPMQPQPSMTMNRNPTQMFNTTKVGESGKSMSQNTQNGGVNVEGAMDKTFGNAI